MNLGFIIDNRKCIGCHACTVACKSEHDMPIGVNRTWVKYIEKGNFPDTRRIFSVMRCNHCEDAPCVDICPTSALFTRSNGIVDFDNDRCIGCKSCMQACPYDALYIDPNTKTAAKCNYCAHRIDAGYEPACVNVCPTEAIISGDIDNPQTKIAKMLAREQVTVRKPEKATSPNVFYIEGDEASLSPGRAPATTDFHWSAQTAGVGHHSGAKAGERSLGAANNQNVAAAEAYTKAIALQNGQNNKLVYDSPSKGILWGWEVPAYVFTKAISAGSFLIPFLLQATGIMEVPETALWFAVITALVFLGLTGGFLVKDLDQPKRFLYVLLRPNWTSWLVKGAYIITIYGSLLSVWIVNRLLGWETITPILNWLTIIFAGLTGIYTAFLFAQAKGRDFWQNPLMSFHMLTHSMTASAAFFLIASLFLTELQQMQFWLQAILLGGIVFHLFSIVVEFMTPHATEDIEETAHIILKGRFKRVFWYGVLLFGNIIPMGLILFGSLPLLIIASSLTLFGIWQAIRVMIISPQLISLS